jgi:trigger factor
MKTISAADANRHFSGVLRDVASGEVVTVLSRGKAVATIGPAAADSGQREMARQDLMQRGIPNAKDAPIPVEMFAEQAEKRVRLGLILSDLVKQQNLVATPEQIKAEIEEQASTYEDPKEVVRWFYSDPRRLKDVESVVLEANVIQYVSGLGTITDKAVSFEELSKLN